MKTLLLSIGIAVAIFVFAFIVVFSPEVVQKWMAIILGGGFGLFMTALMVYEELASRPHRHPQRGTKRKRLSWRKCCFCGKRSTDQQINEWLDGNGRISAREKEEKMYVINKWGAYGEAGMKYSFHEACLMEILSHPKQHEDKVDLAVQIADLLAEDKKEREKRVRLENIRHEKRMEAARGRVVR